MIKNTFSRQVIFLSLIIIISTLITLIIQTEDKIIMKHNAFADHLTITNFTTTLNINDYTFPIMFSSISGLSVSNNNVYLIGRGQNLSEGSQVYEVYLIKSSNYGKEFEENPKKISNNSN